MKNLDFEIPEILQYVYTSHKEISTNEISKRVNTQQQQQIELNGIVQCTIHNPNQMQTMQMANLKMLRTCIFSGGRTSKVSP